MIFWFFDTFDVNAMIRMQIEEHRQKNQLINVRILIIKNLNIETFLFINVPTLNIQIFIS